VQTECSEPIVEHQVTRLRAIALAPTVLLANSDAKLGRAVAIVDVAQVRDADGPQGCTLVNDEIDAVAALDAALVLSLDGLWREREG
jgi:hypothetical protein